jgi:predicted adenine nucleotide alpha hydrolase (AANH) superfamily ATPase
MLCLTQEGAAPTLLWYNPNIHPYTEYTARRDALYAYAGQTGLPVLERGGYGLRAFLDALGGDWDSRCGTCYRLRLFETARLAAAQGFEAFSTTLLISPYQDHELLKATAHAAAETHGVPFFYRDFRPFFRPGQQNARERNLYRQKYCGCLFSEEERYS